MTGTAERFTQATDFFGGHVRAAPAHSWSMATPCTDWTVHDLVNHVVNEQLWVEPLIQGSSIAEVGDRFDGDLIVMNTLSSSKNAVCSGRAALSAAFAGDSNRAIVTTVPSAAIAVVDPRNPIAPFMASARRSCRNRRRPSPSDVLLSIT